MVAELFSSLARSLTVVGSRRNALTLAVSGALSLLGLTDTQDVGAKNCKKIKNKKKRKKCLAKGNDTTNQPTDGGSSTGGGGDGGGGGVPPVRQTVARTFSNTGSISMTGGTTTPYPSTIIVSGLTNGKIVDVNLILRNFSHTWPADVDIMLAATHLPGNALVMADAGGDVDANNLTLTLDDQAANQLPGSSALFSGSFRPANHPDDPGETDVFPSAPAPIGTGLTTFNGQNPNGTWQLFVRDDFAANENGSIAGGWTLDMLVEIDV